MRIRLLLARNLQVPSLRLLLLPFLPRRQSLPRNLPDFLLCVLLRLVP